MDLFPAIQKKYFTNNKSHWQVLWRFLILLVITACPTPTDPGKATNKVPTELVLSNSSVKELLPAKTTVGSLSAKDPDEGETFTFALLTGSDNFVVERDTLKTNAILKFSANSFFDIKIKVSDKAGGALEKDFRITVIEDKAKADAKAEQEAIAAAKAKFKTNLTNSPLPYAARRRAIPAGELNKRIEVRQEPKKEDGDFDCTPIVYRAAAEYDENIILNPQTDVFFPGAVLKGESIDKGTYVPLGVGNRQPITMSVSLPNISGDVSREIKDPKLSTIRQAQIDILSQKISGSTPAQISFEIRRVSSIYDMQAMMGGGFDHDDLSRKFAAAFDFDGKKVRFVIKYVQTYYSMDVDNIPDPADLFKDVRKFNASDIGVMPVYVSSVKYGRMVFFSVESSQVKESEKVEAAINAAFKKGNEKGNFSLTAEHTQILKNATMKATIIGGSGAQAALAVDGIDGVKKFLREGGDYSKDSPGAPIGYSFKSIYDNAKVKAVLSSEYTVKKCAKVRDQEQAKKTAFNVAVQSKKIPYEEARSKIPVAERGKTDVKVSAEAPKPSGNYVCTVTKYKANPEYSENIILNPNTDVFFAGAVIKGESIENGKYILLGVDNRTDVTVSTSLEGIDGNVSKTIQPTLSEMRQAYTDILKQKTSGATGAKISFSIEQIYSKSQINLAIGAGYNYDDGVSTSADINASFNFSESSTKSRFLVKYVQEYYSMDINQKPNAAAFFKDISKIDAATLGDMPMYIASVKFGRIVFFAVESSENSSTMKAALDAAFKSAQQSGNVKVDVDQEKVLNTSSIKGTIIGGSGEDAAKSILGIEGIKEFITKGGNYSANSPGKAIGFNLKSIYDGAAMKAILSTEYNIRQCNQVSDNYKVTVLQLKSPKGGDGVGDDVLELYGTIILKPKAGSNTGAKTVWNRSSDNYISIDTDDPLSVININESLQYTYTIAEIKAGQEFQIYAKITDDDKSSPDDLIGEKTHTFTIGTAKLGQESSFVAQEADRSITITYKVEKGAPTGN